MAASFIATETRKVSASPLQAPPSSLSVLRLPWLRLARWSWTFTALGCRLAWLHFRRAASHDPRQYWAAIRRALVELGPTWIKLGQYVATRRDLVGDDVVRELGRLHDDVLGASDTKHLSSLETTKMAQLLGCSAEDVRHVHLVGSGSVAAVFRVELADGRRVAVKQRHPRVDRHIEEDLRLLHALVAISDSVFKLHVFNNTAPARLWSMIEVPEQLQHFSSMLNRQVDLRDEAVNMRQFHQNFSFDNHVRFPQVYASSEEMLIEEFIDGVPVKYFIVPESRHLNDDNEDHPRLLLNRRVAAYGLQAFLKMMVDDNFLHADLHPGNLMVEMRNQHGELFQFAKYDSENDDNDVVETAMRLGYTRPTIVFLDTGLTTSLTQESLENFLDLFTAVVDGDGRRVARLMVERSPRRPPEHLNLPRFEEQMHHLITTIHAHSLKLRIFPLSDLLNQALAFVRENTIPVDPRYTNLIVSLITMEGLGRSLDPDIDLLSAARPFLRSRWRGHRFYTQHHGLAVKLSAFLEAKFWVWDRAWSQREYAVVDTLMFNNF